MPKYSWSGWEAEPDITGDGSGDPEKFYAFVWEDGEEYACVVHRTCGAKYPLTGSLAEEKLLHVQRIADALTESCYEPSPDCDAIGPREAMGPCIRELGHWGSHRDYATGEWP